MLSINAAFTALSLKTTAQIFGGESPAGMVGWALSFSPKDSGTRQLSEKLNNWLLRGSFTTNVAVQEGFQHKEGAKNLLIYGVDNNGAQRSAEQKPAMTITFQERQATELQEFVHIGIQQNNELEPE